MERKELPKDPIWQSAEVARFWGNIARGEHILQVYESEKDLMHTLFDFATDGLRSDEAVLMIATPDHLLTLEDKLRQAGHNMFSFKLQQQYIPVDASVLLAEFMLNGTPDPILFRLAISSLIKRAKRNQRPLRAFGEMVPILWQEGNTEAAIMLEQLWNDYMNAEPFTLLCGYPASLLANQPDRYAEVHQRYRRYLCGEQTVEQQVLFRAG